MIALELPDPLQLAESVAQGNRSAVANALNIIDNKRPEAKECAAQLLSALPQKKLLEGGHIIGITGPPGAGKSSLVSALIHVWREAGITVGVLAVDPSSRISGGALLGDRLRIKLPQFDEGLFIRSLASRGHLGGLASEVWPMGLVLSACFDLVIIETIGVGQTEIDIANVSDTVCYIAQPASGDSIQYLKSGIMEIPDILVVNKADLGDPAKKTARELRRCLAPVESEQDWTIPVSLVSASEGSGIEKLVQIFAEHRTWLSQANKLTSSRVEHQAAWGIKLLREEFGRHGLELVGGESTLLQQWTSHVASPLEIFEVFRKKILNHWKKI